MKAHWYYFLAGALGLVVLFAIGRVVLSDGSSSAEPTSVSAQVFAAASRASIPDVISDPVDPSAPVDAPVEPLPEGVLPVSDITSSQFITMIDDPMVKIDTAAVNQMLRVTAAAITSPTDGTSTIYTTTFVDDQLPVIMGAYTEHNVEVIANPASSTTYISGGRYPVNPMTGQPAPATGGMPWFSVILIVLLAITVLLIVLRYVGRRQMTKAASASNEVEERPVTRFADVAGCDEAVEELQEIVELLTDPERFSRTGAKPRKGALLCGPPGTGKTMLARAVAGEAGVPFFSASGSDFVEMYVGVGARRIRDLFARARKHPAAIIFIDEIDAVGKSRSSGTGGNSNSETENTLNALLVEMDGFHQSRIIVIGATNRDDMLDKALVRPGRLDRKVHVGLPDRVGREKILAVHVKDRPLAEGVNLNLIARRTPGMSGAELEQIVNEACMFAARAERELVTDEDFDHAVATVAMGKARTSAVVTDHDRLVTAWHEAGHATIGLVLPDAWDVTSISIIPRGPAGGVTWFAEGDDVFLTRRQAFARIVTAMGGRAAEELLLDGEFTSGPYGDLQQATNTAIAMITKYGMTEHGLAHRPDEILASGSNISDDVWAQADAILAEALDVARATLAGHRELFDAIVDGLLEYDTLTASQIEDIRAGKEITPPDLPTAPKEYAHKPVDLVPVPTPARGPVIEPWRDDDDLADSKWGWRPGRRKRRIANAIDAAVWGWRHSDGQGSHRNVR